MSFESMEPIPEFAPEAIEEDVGTHPFDPAPSISAPLLVTVALLAAMAPFATDLYLPAFPLIARSLVCSPAAVQASLMAFLVGSALGQLFFGPLSDRFGRVPPLVAGTIVCVAASAAAALSPDIQFLVGARFVQGLAAAAGMVVGRAILSDRATSRAEAARAFNIAMMVGGIAPIVAPWTGSLLVGTIGWRGTLWTVFGIALVTLGAVFAFVRESHPPRLHPSGGERSAHPDSRFSVLWNRQFLGYTFAFGLAFASMMAYISASPFLFQVAIGLSVRQYGLVFGAIALVLMGAGALSAHLSKTVPAHDLLRLGLFVLIAGALALDVVVSLGCPIGWILLPIAVAVASQGFILGNATSSALSAVPRAVGAGSALLGALQFGFGAAVAPLVGLLGERSAVPLALVMTTTSILALVAFGVAERGSESKPSA